MDKDEILSAIKEAVEEALEGLDLESKIEDALDDADIEGRIEDIIGDADIEGLITEAMEHVLTFATVTPLVVRSRDRKKALALRGGLRVSNWRGSFTLNLQITANNYQDIGVYKTEEEALADMDRILAAQARGEKMIEL